MFLDNLVDDRETEAGALFPRGDIGLDDPLPIVRQADAVVLNGNQEALIVGPHAHLDPTSIVRLGIPTAAFDGFHRIFHDVGQGLSDLVPVTQDADRQGIVIVETKIDLRMGNLLKEHRLTDQIERIFRPEHRFGQARK
jgi:hypothetical protein